MAEWYGLTEEAILERIEDGDSLSEIAASVGKNRSMLTRWIAQDEQRSARARSVRALAAAAWDEKAEAEIRQASDPFELSKAKELSHHYRWRASKIGHKEYGDKLDLNHGGGISVRLNTEDADL